jgi:putative colanic acid biosynthesis acetyltransferase WcaF
MKIKFYNPIQTSPFSLKIKIKAKIWSIVNKTIFRYNPFFAKKIRIILLRFFGGEIDRTCSVNKKSVIDHPWNLKMGRLSSLGEGTWVYCLDKIEIGEKSCIGKDVYLLTGSHDLESSNFCLVTKPIVIENGVWVSTGARILPNVSLGEFSVVAAGAIVVKNVNPYEIVGGNPAKFIKKRKISE